MLAKENLEAEPESFGMSHRCLRRETGSKSETTRDVCSQGASEQRPMVNFVDETGTVQQKLLPSFEEFMSKRNRSPPCTTTTNQELIAKFKLFKDMLGKTAKTFKKDLTGRHQIVNSNEQIKSIDAGPRADKPVPKKSPFSLISEKNPTQSLTKIVNYSEKQKTYTKELAFQTDKAAGIQSLSTMSNSKVRNSAPTSTINQVSRDRHQERVLLREGPTKALNLYRTEASERVENPYSCPLIKSENEIQLHPFPDLNYLTSRSMDRNLDEFNEKNHTRKQSDPQHAFVSGLVSRLSIETEKSDRTPIKPTIFALKHPNFSSYQIGHDDQGKTEALSLEEVMAELARVKNERDQLAIEKNLLEKKCKQLTATSETASNFIQILSGSDSPSTKKVLNIQMEGFSFNRQHQKINADTSFEKGLKQETQKLNDRIKDLEIDNSALRSLVTNIRTELQRAKTQLSKFKSKYSHLKQLTDQVKETQFLELTKKLDLNDSSSTIKARDACNSGSNPTKRLLGKVFNTRSPDNIILVRDKLSRSSSSCSQSQSSLKQSILLEEQVRREQADSSFAIEEDNSRILSTDMATTRDQNPTN